MIGKYKLTVLIDGIEHEGLWWLVECGDTLVWLLDGREYKIETDGDLSHSISRFTRVLAKEYNHADC